MNPSTLRLENQDSPKDRKISELEAELRQVRRELADAELEASRAREDSSRALSMLRGQLSPLYRALQAVFGELDAAGVSDTSSRSDRDQPMQSERVSAVWEAWKKKLPPGCGKIIDALLIHSDLNGTQICVAAQIGKGSLHGLIYKLNKAGLINKNGGRFSLKQL
jgi:chromosome segregation ATPase